MKNFNFHITRRAIAGVLLAVCAVSAYWWLGIEQPRRKELARKHQTAKYEEQKRILEIKAAEEQQQAARAKEDKNRQQRIMQAEGEMKRQQRLIQIQRERPEVATETPAQQ